MKYKRLVNWCVCVCMEQVGARHVCAASNSSIFNSTLGITCRLVSRGASGGTKIGLRMVRGPVLTGPEVPALRAGTLAVPGAWNIFILDAFFSLKLVTISVKVFDFGPSFSEMAGGILAHTENIQ